ncbi:MAG: HAMP domain-containing sensor histidine kinase [Chitinophagaceae bacterium]
MGAIKGQVKRIFTIITVLISLSLVGIIINQTSALRNMISLKREQIKHSVNLSVQMVGEELSHDKGNNLIGKTKKGQGLILPDDFSMDIFKPLTVASRFDVAQIRDKIQRAFLQNNLKNVKFEFGIASFDRMGNPVFQKASPGFITVFEDTLNNYSTNSGLTALSGTAGENLSVDEMLFVAIPDINKLALKSLFWRILISGLFTLIIIAAFYLTVRTMLRQKKLAEIKNDFINNMTHEFKTPIATISLAVDAMRNEKVLQDRNKLGYFSGIIKEENQRMNRQVETILKASQLEKQEVDLNLKPVHVHEVIKDVVDNFTLQLEEKKGKVELDLHAATDLIAADEVHFSNLVNNLVDNAVKYAKENTPPFIRLSTESNGKHFIMRIEDNGIGMNRDTVKRIFEKFYRAHTGNVHNVKGFGLGLSYVKTMVEAHDGEIKAESTLGKGSIFTIDFPLSKN